MIPLYSLNLFCFQITYIKKDEGFESDGESSSTTTTSSNTPIVGGGDSVDKSAAGVEIKIIKDHVSDDTKEDILKGFYVTDGQI